MCFLFPQQDFLFWCILIIFQPVEDVLIPPGSGALIPFSVFSGHHSTKTDPLSCMSFTSLFLGAYMSFFLFTGGRSAVCLCLHFPSCLEVYMYTAAAAEVGVYLDCCSLPAGCTSTSSTCTRAIFSSSFALRFSRRHRSDRRQRAGRGKVRRIT